MINKQLSEKSPIVCENTRHCARREDIQNRRRTTSGEELRLNRTHEEDVNETQEHRLDKPQDVGIQLLVR